MFQNAYKHALSKEPSSYENLVSNLDHEQSLPKTWVSFQIRILTRVPLEKRATLFTTSQGAPPQLRRAAAGG